MLFSHDVVRESQKDLVDAVLQSLKTKKHLIAHAPTGLGKTAAALCPALDFAKDKDYTIFFLTSRHTQHKIVLDTIKKLNDKNNTNFSAVSLIGKKWMCAQDVENLPASDFTDYCKSLVENNQCEFYLNARGKNNMRGRKLLTEIQESGPVSSELMVQRSVSEMVCPYELSLMLAENSKVIIADYYYIFHPHIREVLFNKIKKTLDQVIIIVDEGHNLPSRMRDVFTFRLSNKMMRLAIQEAKKYGLDVVSSLVEIQDALNKLSDRLDNGKERLVRKEQFIGLLEKFKPYDEILAELDIASEVARSEQNVSHIGRVARFCEEWELEGEGFARLVSRKDMFVTLSVRCLDPALVTKDVFDSCYDAIVMSGTLSPTAMYADVLGISNATQMSFPSPFPEKNRLSMIVPRTTTKFTMRSERQYREIARLCADVSNRLAGPVMLFFPSYSVRDSVAEFFGDGYDGFVFYEKPGMQKGDKQQLLDKFSSKSRSVLMCVASGSFGEGVDLPGVLKGVIVIGLPLDKPDLETTELISYYDKKFGKGWEYGYTLPAMTRCIQNAGRCIRSEKDRGVLVFLDERYAWPRYRLCFPPEWKLNITLDYADEISRFFGRLA